MNMVYKEYSENTISELRIETRSQCRRL